MDVAEDRAGLRSTIIASQLPVSDWRHLIADPSIADAVLDRLVHRSVRIELAGESLRSRTPNGRLPCGTRPLCRRETRRRPQRSMSSIELPSGSATKASLGPLPSSR